jgi:outer membrane protein assembly factor BamA
VVFFLENVNDAGTNVNERYMVERVEVRGYDDSKLSQSIRDDIKALVGQKLDQDEAEDIQQRISDELRPRHYVERRVVKGSDRQHIVLVFDVHDVRWIPFIAQPPNHLIYHSNEHFSGAIGANLFGNRTTRFNVGAANDQDMLLERFAGFNVTFEATRVGTDRLGLALRYARYRQQWAAPTVLEGTNQIYRHRNTFDPTFTIAFDPRVRMTAGVSLSELQIQYPQIHTDHSNAAIASMHFDNFWGKSRQRNHTLTADYSFSAGNHQLDSDFIYTRHFAQGQYIFGDKEHHLSFRMLAGTITGNAPLFERFSLGDSMTLRGWNKFEIAPIGGNRVIHGSVQYDLGGGHGRFIINERPVREESFGFHFFYDVGAVGDRGSPIQTKHSAGLGFGSSTSSKFFIDVGFPIRSHDWGPVFIVGSRF